MAYKYLNQRESTLNPDQKVLYEDIKNNNKLQICIPTGAGKGYLMMVDLLRNYYMYDSVSIIASHRLMLNSQHLDDIFNIFEPFIGEIGFIYLGSSTYNHIQYQQRPDINKKLKKLKLSYDDIISSTCSPNDLKEIIEKHNRNGRKIIIFTTYHSLFKLEDVKNIGTAYYDEAHILASEENDTSFQKNFMKVKSNKSLFFTATPKDCVEDIYSYEVSSPFLMNNEQIFGKRVGLNFKECVEKAYITQPIIHLAYPEAYEPDNNFESIKNLSKLVKDTFRVHREEIIKRSYSKNIKPKLLIISLTWPQ